MYESRQWAWADRNSFYHLGAESEPLSARIYAKTIVDASSLMAIYSLTSGSYVWYAMAEPGSALSAEVWQAKEIFDDGTTYQVKWADGDNKFDNAVSGLSGLTYL